MSLTYEEFMWMKRNDPVPAFDWSSDGCSWTPNVMYFDLAKIFYPTYQLHDFGYRNFGKGLRLGHDEKTRAWIDGRLLTDGADL
jgi:Prokaryotic phospholipase A2